MSKLGEAPPGRKPYYKLDFSPLTNETDQRIAKALEERKEKQQKHPGRKR
jgi:hypothetical protein